MRFSSGPIPKRAPSQLNKWGYLVEAMHGGESSVVGLISQENDDRLSDVKADLKTRKEQRAFDTIRGYAATAEGMARVGTLYAPSHLTYHDADTVLDSVLADTSLAVKRVARRGNVRPGFLTSLTELITSSLDKNNDNKRLQYIHGDRLFELRLVDATHLARFDRDGRTWHNVIRGRFETGEAGNRSGTRFELVYGASGRVDRDPDLDFVPAEVVASGRLGPQFMTIHLVNPSDISFGTAVITPRWLYVLAAATPREYGDPRVIDETLDPIDFDTIAAGDVVGVGIHTFNALRGYEIGREARKRGATVVFGGIHPTLYPDESHELGGAHAVVKGDGDVVWATVLADCANGTLQSCYDGGRVDGATFQPARWDLLPADKYMWGSVQTLRGCPKHCSFCSVWKTDGQQPRQRTADAVVREIVELRRMGFRFILLSDDNFYPVTVEDLRLAERQGNTARIESLKEIRRERFELMDKLARLPDDLVFYTQITMEAAEDPEFLKAMNKAKIRGALVGVESVTPEGLKAIFKDFNYAGDKLVTRLKEFRKHGVHVLGSFIFGLPTDKQETFDATAELAQRSDIAFAQFIMLTPFPGTVDFAKWEEKMASDPTRIAGYPLTRFWLIPRDQRPKVYTPHPMLSPDQIRRGTQSVWDRFYSIPAIWERASIIKSLRGRVAFVMISKLYRQMYANTGIATDSARATRSAQWARVLARQCRRLFVTAPMPDLQVPN